jgi:K+-transporting ATPase ATPase A chain
MSPDLALNTAVSFATNTSWQSYGGESTLGYLAQMAGLVVHSFTSAATGIAVALALVRGLPAVPRQRSATSGSI